MIVKTVKIFANSDEKSTKIKDQLLKKLNDNGFLLDEVNYDLGIAIGGDGAFLRMVRESEFDAHKLYIGINTGTLGFAQEVSADHLDDFILKLKQGMYKIENIGIEEIVIHHKEGKDQFFALNDMVIRDAELNTTKFMIYVDNKLLERFLGDGILISTSFGSTAYNLSFGGSVIYNTLHTLQITPIAPHNSKEYRSLSNSIVIPQDKEIRIVPYYDDSNFVITIDGENIFYQGIRKIETYVQQKTIQCLREQDYNFIDKVNEKFLSS